MLDSFVSLVKMFTNFHISVFLLFFVFLFFIDIFSLLVFSFFLFVFLLFLFHLVFLFLSFFFLFFGSDTATLWTRLSMTTRQPTSYISVDHPPHLVNLLGSRCGEA